MLRDLGAIRQRRGKERFDIGDRRAQATGRLLKVRFDTADMCLQRIETGKSGEIAGQCL
jgi:hypothetical protein